MGRGRKSTHTRTQRRKDSRFSARGQVNVFAPERAARPRGRPSRCKTLPIQGAERAAEQPGVSAHGPGTHLVEAAKVSSFSVSTDEWLYDDNGGSVDIYVCKGENDPDTTKHVGTYTYIAGPIGGIIGGNELYLLTEQFEINGCLLQRIGTWDSEKDAPTNKGIWTTTGNNKGCPKASNIADYDYSTVSGTGLTDIEMYTFEFKRPVARTPLTMTSTHSKAKA